MCPSCLLRIGSAGALAGDRDPGDSLLNHLRVLNVIGEGPRGRVFLAEWTTPDGGLAALKCARANTTGTWCEGRLVTLDYPSIATVYEVGTNEALGAYAISDYFPGLPITRYCERRQLALADRLELWLQAADAIGYAHAHGIPHLNLKPNNVLVIEGAVKVLDFERARPDTNSVHADTPLSMRNVLATADARADLMALGALLEGLTADLPGTPGLQPLEGDTVAGLAASVRACLHALSGIKSL